MADVWAINDHSTEVLSRLSSFLVTRCIEPALPLLAATCVPPTTIRSYETGMQYLFLVSGLPKWATSGSDSTVNSNGHYELEKGISWSAVAEHCKAAETRISAIVQHYEKAGAPGTAPESLDPTERAIQQFCLDVGTVLSQSEPIKTDP